MSYESIHSMSQQSSEYAGCYHELPGCISTVTLNVEHNGFTGSIIITRIVKKVILICIPDILDVRTKNDFNWIKQELSYSFLFWVELIRIICRCVPSICSPLSQLFSLV